MQKYLPILRARRERRLAKQRKQSSRARGFVLSAGMLISIFFGAVILFAAFAYADLTRDLPPVEILPRLFNPPDGALLEPTRLYDRTGTRVLFTFAPNDSPRRYIPINPQNPQHIRDDMLNAIIAAQDPQFWNHAGFSTQHINNPNIHPTLAQKLAYEFILFNEPPSFRRAIRERILAAQITAQFGREQVLEWYLNFANFGRYAYGVESAAQLYFGKPAAQLTLAESVILAAANQSPALNPLDAKEDALRRGRSLLDEMKARGIISAERAALALLETPQIQPAPEWQNDFAPAFRNLVISQITPHIPRERVERGGLKIITTLDVELQTNAQCLTETYAARLAQQEEPDCPAASLLAPLPDSTPRAETSASALILDPRLGHVLALVGETNKAKETPLVGEHAGGSLLDAFVYLTAFTRGLSPATLTWDVPLEDGIQNFDGEYHGPVRMRVALVNDYQSPAQTLKLQMGMENVKKIESSFGIDSENVTMLQAAGAFGVFANQGVYFGRGIERKFMPIAALRVEDLNRTAWLDWSIAQSKPVLTPALAYVMTDVLSDESARKNASAFDVNRPVGVKEGQTWEGKDAWVVGYTPAHVAAVWTGAHGEAHVAPRDSAVLWNALIQAASVNSPVESWAMPPGVSTITVCDPSGLLPTKECPRLVNEIFLSGNEPAQADTLYREFDVNRETNLLATVFTPAELVETRVYLIVPDHARSWAANAGLPIPPASYDAIQPPPLNPFANITAPALFAQVEEDVVKIIGTASGADFQSYRVQVGQGLNPKKWIQIGAESTSPVEGGVLAEWDTKGLSGLYAVRLLVIRADQRVDTAVIQVTVK